MRSRGVPKITIGRRGNTMEYTLQVIVDFNRGMERIGLIAYGRDVCKLADVVASLKERFGPSVRIVAWEIDNRRVRGRRESYLYVELEYKPSF